MKNGGNLRHLCGEKEKFLFRKRFRSLVCPPAFGPAKRSQNFGPFRTAFPHFRRFAFRVSLSQFRNAPQAGVSYFQNSRLTLRTSCGHQPLGSLKYRAADGLTRAWAGSVQPALCHCHFVSVFCSTLVIQFENALSASCFLWLDKVSSF
jgi:hypothetical protein